MLTPYGAERAQRAVRRTGSAEYEVNEQALYRIAEASFAEDWDTPADEIYDRA